MKARRIVKCVLIVCLTAMCGLCILARVGYERMKIYLSPSKQPANLYGFGDTNEETQMEEVAKMVESILREDYCCDVKLANLDLGIGEGERPYEASRYEADVYLAIHSNATGTTPTAVGAAAFCHYDSQESILLGTNLTKELDAICPYESTLNESVYNGMAAFDGYGYAEVRNPMKYKIPAVIIEVNFHDNPTTAEWILNNKPNIAQAIVRGLVETYDIPAKIL